MGSPTRFYPNLLKSLYVEVAREEFILNGKPQTDSRISFAERRTSQRCKKVGRRSQQEQAAPPTISLGAKLVALMDQQRNVSG